MRVELVSEPGTGERAITRGAWSASDGGELLRAREMPNNDLILAGIDTCVVLDGVTPQAPCDGCVHGVGWFVRTVGTGLLCHAAEKPRRPLAECLGAAIGATARLHDSRTGGECDLSNWATPQTTVAAVRFTGDRLEYLVLGDCTIVVDRGGDLDVITDQRNDLIVRRFETRSPDVSPGSAQWDALQAEFDQLRNVDGGYWTVAADPAAAGQAITGDFDKGSVSCVLLMTDGASRYVDMFGQSDWPGVLALVHEQGPRELHRRLRKYERDHPEPTRRRGKISDDASTAWILPTR